MSDAGAAQGGLTDTPAGNWHELLFQNHGAGGRVPCFVPLEWKDGWPGLGVAAKVPRKLDSDFKNRAAKACFFFSLDGDKWTAIGQPRQMTYPLPHFMGDRFALCNCATKPAGGFVDNDYFRIREKMGGGN